MSTPTDPYSPDPASAADAERQSIFLAYKDGLEGTNLGSALHDLLSEAYEVFFAKRLIPGFDWTRVTPEKLEQADFFVALMTRDACDSTTSDFLPKEIDLAVKLQAERQRPVVIPVRVAHLEPYDYRLGARLARYQEIYVEDPDDLNGLVKKLVDAFEGRLTPPQDTHVTALAPYSLPELTRRRLAAAFVDLPPLQRAAARLDAHQLVWFTGDPGVRNYAALSLAAVCGARPIYSLPKSKTWSDVNNTLVSEAILVFPDALPLLALAEDTVGRQLAALASLLSRGNRLLLTAPDAEYGELRYHMRQLEFTSFHHERLGASIYGMASKIHILEKSLEVLAQDGAITRRQHLLMTGLLPVAEGSAPAGAPRTGRGAELQQRFFQVLEKWSPWDIERFLLRQLPEISRLSEIARALERNATIEDEVHAWFHGLADSVKCFVLAVALVSGAEPQPTWERYKQIFKRLRELDPNLALWPLGLSRERAAPYVTLEGAVGFSEERVAAAVRREVAKSYREYLIELFPELTAWTLGREGVLEADLAETRTAIATMIGEAARIAVFDLLPLIERWADDGDVRVRDLAALAVERMAQDAAALGTAFALLDRWTVPGEARVWTAAAAYGRIAAAAPQEAAARKALERLVVLAADPRNRVSDHVASAARKLPGHFSLADLEPLFLRLAHSRKAFTRLRLAEAINEARLADEDAGGRLLESWLGAADASLRWVAMCSVVIKGRWRKWGRLAAAPERLGDFLSVDGATLADVLCEAAESRDYVESALAALGRLAASSQLAKVLATALRERADREFLSVLRSHSPRFDTLLIAIRAEQWTTLLARPSELVDLLADESRQTGTAAETLQGIEVLAQSEAETRPRLISALASGFGPRHETVEQILGWLRSAPPASALASLSLAVRREALAALLGEPALFCQMVHADLRHAARQPETEMALVALARPAPAGCQSAFVETLARAYPAATAAVEALLAAFKLSHGALSQVGEKALRKVVEDLLGSPMELLAELRRRCQGAGWEEVLGALEYLSDRTRPTTRQGVARALARAAASEPLPVRALLEDPRLRAHPNLRFLWLRVKVEGFWRLFLPRSD
jgi:hypothetical protein